jgi:hypothetical protein
MRIFLASQQALRPHAVPAYSFWEFYFKNALAEAGHEVIEASGVDWAEGLTSMTDEDRRRWLTDTWSRTVEFIRAEQTRQPIGLFLGYLFPNQVDPSAVSAIRALGVPCVNFFCDNVREFTTVPASYRPFDLHWVPEAEAQAMYAAAGLPHLHAPMAMWIPPGYRTPPLQENSDVSFIGSHDLLREDLLGEANELGLRFRLHGAGWRAGGSTAAPSPGPVWRTLANQVTFLRAHGLKGFAMRATYQRRRHREQAWIDRCWQPALTGDEYFRATRESAVIIGINRYPSFRHSFSHPARYSRLRDIEAPMLGACYLTEDAPGLASLYELGREIETYRDAAELVEKATRLVRDPERRASLRRLGQRRALSDHTIARSLDRILARLAR